MVAKIGFRQKLKYTRFCIGCGLHYEWAISSVVDLLEQILARSAAGETIGVCTVVRTRGSTPQKQGAMMLVLADGTTLGTLGGGCVEAEVRVRSMRLMERSASELLTFKLDHDYGWDDGLVCGGAMEIAVQVIKSGEGAQVWRSALADVKSRREARVKIELADETGATRQYEHVVARGPKLVIAGAGHVAMALARIVRAMDFEIVVIDDRVDFASAERFPGATCVVGDIERELTSHPIDPHCYVVVVTRGHKHDGNALASVIASPAKYVGLIGSKRKVLTILKDLRDRGIPRETLLRVHAPIGLDLGAITPSEIAVSIAAEMIAVRRGKEVPNSMQVASDLLDRALT
jgi:xanthine dehydrogenase accessory factor